MSPGLFLGWRIDPGLRYRGVLRVLDYQEYRTKKNALAVDVPQDELFVDPGLPCFPVAFARDKALKEGRGSDVSEFPEIDLRELSFPPEGGHLDQRPGGSTSLQIGSSSLRTPQVVRDA